MGGIRDANGQRAPVDISKRSQGRKLLCCPLLEVREEDKYRNGMSPGAGIPGLGCLAFPMTRCPIRQAPAGPPKIPDPGARQAPLL